MSDPDDILNKLTEAEDAFKYTHGDPNFEPMIDSSTGADPGKVAIQKACRLIELSWKVTELGDYYGQIVENSFIAMEQTFMGYLLLQTGINENELRDHNSPYELSKKRVPLTVDTIQSISTLYNNIRTEHYYGTTVSTQHQAEAMRDLATGVHGHVVEIDGEVERCCNCE
ncbi:MAG: hypothetical protein ABEK59_06780 [Halobacteria archaeon]